MSASKVSKASVNYRKARKLARKRCGTCSMYRERSTNGPGHCTLVAGNIYPLDVCDRWEAKP